MYLIQIKKYVLHTLSLFKTQSVKQYLDKITSYFIIIHHKYFYQYMYENSIQFSLKNIKSIKK